MWALSNQTKFKAARTFVRDRDGAEIWIVAVRATFSIDLNGAVTPAELQQEVCQAPKHFGSPESTSLRYDTDLVRMKDGTDVLVHAHAHAPGRRAAKMVEVGFRIGPISKGLRVVGDRSWQRQIVSVTPGDPTPFVTKPIRYESAWGGRLPSGEACDPTNPIGVGRLATPGARMPSCELPGAPVRSSSHGPPPAGFGPIPCHWQPRARLAGTYDDTWKNTRKPLVPTDFQDAYFRCAPPDQQVRGFLRGGEDCVLLNLTPEGRLRFQLPRVTFGFATRFGNSGLVYHRGDLHTVVVEPEDRLLVMVWHSALPCHHKIHQLEKTIVYEKNVVSRQTPSPPIDADVDDDGLQMDPHAS